jgi:hypothetical protein
VNLLLLPLAREVIIEPNVSKALVVDDKVYDGIAYFFRNLNVENADGSKGVKPIRTETKEIPEGLDFKGVKLLTETQLAKSSLGKHIQDADNEDVAQIFFIDNEAAQSGGAPTQGFATGLKQAVIDAEISNPDPNLDRLALLCSL